MKNDFTYCTIKYKHCKKQKSCKRWICNYSTYEQGKALYNPNIWFTCGNTCVNSSCDMYIEIKS